MRLSQWVPCYRKKPSMRRDVQIKDSLRASHLGLLPTAWSRSYTATCPSIMTIQS